ncbi:hypothetical protein [Paenibacillus contaminans]|uniref:Uncharacterized protein n=1 Tax=Paenibacillus contaminans TaxID=450362 RepID=A0A329MGX5_9BACL|nr:hypothetical protein [Paenibacillus contaminans]RAV18868.1 hypothetical protein DQG23_24380 [Paenibacillus contaminans]
MKTQVKAAFQDFNAGANKTIIKLEVKSELTDEQIVALHKLKKGSIVFVQIASGQVDIDDYDDEDGEDSERQGVTYSTYKSGIVDAPGNQMSIDDLPPKQEGEQAADAGEREEGDAEAGKQDGEQVSEQSQEDEQQQPTDNVTDLGQARKRRGRQSKAEQEAANDAQPDDQEKPADEGASDPADENYDDLPY